MPSSVSLACVLTLTLLAAGCAPGSSRTPGHGDGEEAACEPDHLGAAGQPDASPAPDAGPSGVADASPKPKARADASPKVQPDASPRPADAAPEPKVPACPPGSPKAVLRHHSSFDTHGASPASPVTIGLNNKTYSYGGPTWLQGLRVLIWAKSSILSHSTAATRKGAGALLAEVGAAGYPSISGSERHRAEAEIMHGATYPWDDGKSYWVGFSVRPAVVSPQGAWSYYQLHAPVQSPKVDGMTSDSIMLRPIWLNGKPHYQFRVVDGAVVASACGATCGTKEKWNGPIALNTWTDFVFNFTLSSKGKGYVHLWVDGKSVYSQTGMTNVQHLDAKGKEYLNRTGLPSRIGIYGPDGSAPSPYSKVHFDELREAVGCDGYTVVDPAQ